MRAESKMAKRLRRKSVVGGEERVFRQTGAVGSCFIYASLCLPHPGKSMFRDLERNSRGDSRRKTVFAEILAS